MITNTFSAVKLLFCIPCYDHVLQILYSSFITDGLDVPFLSADIVDGNLKSVMRIILALAAHFKPSANQRAASGSGRGLTRGSASHNPLSPVALAQGAAAALASARLDASQPAHATRIHRYAGHNNHKHRHKAMSVSLYNILMCETCSLCCPLLDKHRSPNNHPHTGWSLLSKLYASSYLWINNLHFFCHLSVAGDWMWKRVCVFVHWLSSMKDDHRMSRSIFSLAGNLLLHKLKFLIMI